MSQEGAAGAPETRRDDGALYLVQKAKDRRWEPARWSPGITGYGPWWVLQGGYWCHMAAADVVGEIGPLPQSILEQMRRHADQARDSAREDLQRELGRL